MPERMNKDLNSISIDGDIVRQRIS